MHMLGHREVCFWLESGVRRPVLCWYLWKECGFCYRENVFKIYLVCKLLYILDVQCDMQI
jgi:hypothetical protein